MIYRTLGKDSIFSFHLYLLGKKSQDKGGPGHLNTNTIHHAPFAR